GAGQSFLRTGRLHARRLGAKKWEKNCKGIRFPLRQPSPAHHRRDDREEPAQRAGLLRFRQSACFLEEGSRAVRRGQRCVPRDKKSYFVLRSKSIGVRPPVMSAVSSERLLNFAGTTSIVSSI